VLASRRALLSPTERKHSWHLAEVSGDTTPYAFQHLLRWALRNPEAVRCPLRIYVRLHLTDASGVLVRAVFGGRRPPIQRHGGRIEHSQIGVSMGSASSWAQAWLDRELSQPTEWANHRDRCQYAGIPEGRCLTTKPQLVVRMLRRAFTAGIPSTWITGDSVYGDDLQRRMWLQARPQASGLAVAAPGRLCEA
jgi:hypothetical protein